MKKFIIITLILVVAGVAGVSAIRMKDKGSDAVEVEIGAAERRTVTQTVEASGRIQPQTQVNISADVSAKIIRLEVKEGDLVVKGQLLLELDRERYVAAVERQEANLRSGAANADLVAENVNQTRRDLSRTRDLFEKSLESQATLDRLAAAYEVEKARHQASLEQVEQARASLKSARNDLAKTRIVAPMSGTISQLNKELGEIALGSQFQEDVIMVIADLEGMEAVVDVGENDIVSVKIGDSAKVEVDAVPNVILDGVVTEIAHSAKVSGQGSASQKTEFEVHVRIDRPDPRLRPGMTADSEIVTEVHEETLAIPIQAVAVRTPAQLETTAGLEPPELEPDRDGFCEIVFVIDGDRVLARQIQTGIQSASDIEITSGLEAGESIVIGNYRAISKDLKHGTMVAEGGES